MKITKKITLSLATLASASIPTIAVISCSSNPWKKFGYDLAIAVPPINTLNYVKSNALFKIEPTLLQGIKISGPGTALKNQLQIPQFQFSEMSISHDKSTLELPTFERLTGDGIYTLSDVGVFAGNAKMGNKGLGYIKSVSGYTEYIGVSLNGIQKWKGTNSSEFNRIIEAQDYIDYVKYCTDLNVGSPKIVKFQEAKIYGLEEFIEAQKAYSKQFGYSYKYPWGKNIKIESTSKLADFQGNIGNNFWPSQIANDSKYVQKIKNAALKFLLGGMRISAKSIFPDDNNQNKDTSKTDFFIHFENKTTTPWEDQFSFIGDLLPINKEFVDSIGGIENFGSSLQKWQYSSPFDITDISLGQGGFIDIQKDYSWNTSEYTMANKIKIYFNDDPNVLSALFDDKYISATDIPGIYQSKFWANPDIRQFMTKRNGYGTQGLQMNLDKEKNSGSPLLNENFRNAIAHAIDRERLIKLLNWDASFPISTWTPLGGIIKSQDGRVIDDFFSSETLKGPYDEKEYSLLASSWISNTAKGYKFESAYRKDNRFNIKVAKKYFEDFQKETNNYGKITLKYLSADKTNLNAGLGIKSMLYKAFDGLIDIKIKSVPANTYESLRKNGEFDLTTFNFDQYGSSLDSYMKRLFIADEIDYQKNKNDGFIDNPTGSWTFNDWYKQHQNELKKYEEYFGINSDPKSDENKVWQKIQEIIAIDSRKNRADLIEQTNEIWQGTDDFINTPELQFKFISILEKIIALSSPIIPLLDVDNAWSVSRLYSVSDTFKYSLQFAYDVLNKPRPNLPGKDVMIGER